MSDTVRSFVEAEKQAGRNVSKACELLEVSRSAYYASILAREAQDDSITRALDELHLAVVDVPDRCTASCPVGDGCVVGAAWR